MKRPSERDRRAASLLDQVLRLASSERADFLDRACADDLELRRQVEETLAIVNDLGDRQRVDCGPGTQPYETRGYITDLRVAPNGNWVAFL